VKVVSWDDGAVDSGGAAGIGAGIGLGIWLIIIVVSYVLAEGDLPAGSKMWAIMGWHGCDSLRIMVNRQSYEDWEPNTAASEWTAMFSHATMPLYFGMFIKYVDPIILFLMIVDTWRTRYYDPYGDYQTSQLAVGWLIFTFALFLGIFPALCPVLMMGVDEAQAFDGFDLSVWIAGKLGYDLKHSEFLGFGQGTKAEDTKEAEMVGTDKRTIEAVH